MLRPESLLIPLIVAGAGACGRLGFDPHDGRTDGGGSGDDAPTDGMVDAGFTANVVFVTSTLVTGNIGGIAAGDTLCQQEADDAGLAGTYIAWLSTSTVDAIDRLGSARGWVRADGEPVFDTLGTWEMFNPINRDARGQFVSAQYAFTATDSTGRYYTAFGACSDWMSESGTGGMGELSGAGNQYSLEYSSSCATPRPIYCFGIDKAMVVAPRVTAGRLVFASQAGRTTPGVVALDTICQDEATAASLPGTFHAAIATTTASAASRFQQRAEPWVRLDGTKVADGGLALFEAGTHTSFVNQTAQPGYGSPFMWSGAVDGVSTGTMASTCSDWADTSAGSVGINGKPTLANGSLFWQIGTTSCASGQGLLCLQD